MKKKAFIITVVVLLLPLVPILLPIALIYLFAAVNLSKGYSRLYCGGVRPSTRDIIIESLEDKGVVVPAWLKTKPRSCS
ncbi:hypothetical protein [Candidatus Magnetomonas plexicatena]|uniref:hypothetical protein n=1 Tax=Candidatus Magnetomonas plexicatena TaxID=2552947 RepID=UPI001C78A678|nr:hypothetical protein E2O03_013305 [Nitrospirales bacterium LBB_01]